MIVHATGSVPLGILADKWVRKRIIAIGVSIWSIATFFTGLSYSFTQLLITRSVVGIGEASYAPAATSLIADHYPSEKRAKASSIFHLGMFLGGTLGMVLSGIISTHLGWRACFFIVAVPGLILVYFVMKVNETRHESHSAKDVTKENIINLFRSPAYVVTLIAGIMLTFTSSTIIAWMTQFFIRYHNYNVEQAGLTIGIAILVSGPIGIYSGGHLSDLMYTKYKLPRSTGMAFAFIAATPLMYIVLTTQNEVIMIIALIIASYLMTWYYGPMVALIQDIVPGYLKATAFAFYLFTVHIIGSTPAPALIGKLSDLFDLQSALYVIIVTNLLGGLLLLVTTKILWKKRGAA
jgi:MFS transporter, Spinster family, sphingosine-1-phosphate transporter